MMMNVVKLTALLAAPMVVRGDMNEHRIYATGLGQETQIVDGELYYRLPLVTQMKYTDIVVDDVCPLDDDVCFEERCADEVTKPLGAKVVCEAPYPFEGHGCRAQISISTNIQQVLDEADGGDTPVDVLESCSCLADADTCADAVAYATQDIYAGQGACLVPVASADGPMSDPEWFDITGPSVFSGHNLITECTNHADRLTALGGQAHLDCDGTLQYDFRSLTGIVPCLNENEYFVITVRQVENTPGACKFPLDAATTDILCDDMFVQTNEPTIESFEDSAGLTALSIVYEGDAGQVNCALVDVPVPAPPAKKRQAPPTIDQLPGGSPITGHLEVALGSMITDAPTRAPVVMPTNFPTPEPTPQPTIVVTPAPTPFSYNATDLRVTVEGYLPTVHKKLHHHEGLEDLCTKDLKYEYVKVLVKIENLGPETAEADVIVDLFHPKPIGDVVAYSGDIEAPADDENYRHTLWRVGVLEVGEEVYAAIQLPCGSSVRAVALTTAPQELLNLEDDFDTFNYFNLTPL